MIDRVQWLGNSAFRIEGPPLIYIDPWRVSRSTTPADVILISSDLYDHCSPPDIAKLYGPNTLVVADATAAEALGGEHCIQTLRPWQCINAGKARITAIPAQTPTGRRYLPESSGLGFLISMDYYDIYYAGDTTLLPDMARLRPDIAILPIGSGSAMSLSEAVEAVKVLHPKWVIPGHWEPGRAGSYLDARAFQQAVGDLAEVVILQQTR